MKHRWALTCVTLTALVTLAATSAVAGPVTINAASATIYFSDSTGSAAHSRSTPVAVGDFVQFTYDGYDGETPPTARGDALVFYSFQPSGDGFQLYVQERHHTLVTPLGAGGSASFSLTFTNVVPLTYAFETNATGLPAFFAAALEPSPGAIEATAQYAGGNAWTGSIPHSTDSIGNTTFTPFARYGTLPPGTRTLTVTSTTYSSEFGNPSTSEGYLKFNVEPATTAVPLPAGVWTGAAGLLAALLATCVRQTSR